MALLHTSSIVKHFLLGTMVVVEDGRRYVGKKIELNVTSIIQTSSGRMVFGKVSENNEPLPSNPRKSGNGRH